MAYTHSKMEVIMSPLFASTFAGTIGYDADLTTATTAEAARWAPGVVPHLVRGVSIGFSVNTASNITAGVAVFRHEIPANTGTTSATTIATLNFPTTLSLATTNVIYQEVTGHVEIKPGQSVGLRMSTVATTGERGVAVLYVEPRWETPANLTNMIQTT